MRLLHISVIASNLAKSKLFYEKVLGLEPDMRPDLGFDGAFYKLAGGQQLHLMCMHDPYQGCVRPKHGGQDRHMAFAVDDLEVFKARLRAQGLDYTVSRSGRAAMFCYDPDGNAVELCELSKTSA